MSFDILESLRRARLGDDRPSRRQRSDKGRSRLAPELAAHLLALLGGIERPPMADVLRELHVFCDRHGLASPWRSTIYDFLAKAPVPAYPVSELPPPVRAALHNLTGETRVPAHQLAFHCFNYGGTAAMSYAASLPWLALYQAARLRGFRPKSRGVLEAVLRARGIT